MREERRTDQLTRRFSGNALEMNGRIERDWIHLALVLIVPFAERRREGWSRSEFLCPRDSYAGREVAVGA
jgi:hypothetical protein